MNRDRSYYHKQRRRTIQKKSNLLRRLGGKDFYDGWTRGYPGRLAKGKIHCSCWMCRTKSYDFLSHRDAKQAQSARQQIKDCSESEGITMGIFGDSGIFGDMFDLNGDGRVDCIEQSVELLFLDDLVKDEDSFDDDGLNDDFDDDMDDD